ncbi:hypothetical protein Poli38472_011046 [Pythium oligandrum]|uniref:Vacuolar protein 8 n=1 Tax=Pythium oligandrum TaxID=41045 RepID=A0A8K1FLR4_PYTOL|nr:hypothetical protein Poli38472_011046 [Pythium oligandrum]|eukprot:TMW67426.1 hypothetical protein Poli38472_011046 [Pythium oligandrum]
MMRRTAGAAKTLAQRTAARRAPQPTRRVLCNAPVASANVQPLPRSVLLSTVRAMSSFASDTPLSLWEIAEQLRAPEAIRGDREQVVQNIQSVVITAATTDAREQQALEIIQSNVLEPLLGFLADERLADLHIPTFLTLIKLSSESLIVQELLRLDGAAIVAKYLSPADPRLQAAACLTLGNLALDPLSETTMATATVIDPLLQALESPHEAIQRTAVTTLANIAGSTQGREYLCQPEQFIPLCALLSAENSDSLRSAVAFALGNVLSGHDVGAQEGLRESGALPELILMVSPAFPDDVCSSAAWAIHHGVHMNHENQSMVADAGGLGMLFQQAFSENEAVQTNALLALESVTIGHEENTQRCRDNTEAVTILKYLQRDSADDLNVSAKRALQGLLSQLE